MPENITPTYRGPAMMEAFKRDLIHVVEEWEKRRETMLADPEAKARFFTFRAFELTQAAILDDTPAPVDHVAGSFLPTEDGEFNGNEQADPETVAAIVPPHCSGGAFVFDPGILHVKKDGSGFITINEDEFQLEDDRCEGPDGPEGSVFWIARMDASEIVALRNFLNGAPTPRPDMNVPEGWQLVPKKPTMEMVKAAHRDHEGDPWLPYSLWTSMLSATPTPPVDHVAMADALRLVVAYDDLLRTHEGPSDTLFAGDVAEIDAAYDEMVAAARAALAAKEADRGD
ncbi:MULTISPECIES: hypothetical protein [unclassified Rhizobium]|uniref:hypothetical protein n=1 Tax=unclassified Rhizobium TaxID=2613769 RepID=UPI0006FC770E|nr:MULTISPECIES: hypothetical protein [unclassified Rhizobium]KQV43256.1 hypothetical protein ASC86_00020 [Rhizobium sp. Root1212]KRD37441.1 hypothetical protein ASE37_00020 [Rhizobium sp. Root268]